MSISGSSPGHPVISLVQSRNALPLHPIKCHMLMAGTSLSPKGAQMLIPFDRFCAWTVGLSLSWDSPGRALDRICLPLSP